MLATCPVCDSHVPVHEACRTCGRAFGPLREGEKTWEELAAAKKKSFLPMRCHKYLVIQCLKNHPEDFRKFAPDFEGTVDQFIQALTEHPGQWIVGGELKEEAS